MGEGGKERGSEWYITTDYPHIKKKRLYDLWVEVMTTGLTRE
jgi:hypothetical protein